MRTVLLLALLLSPAARAGTLERVQGAGVLRCAAAERAGFAAVDEAGRVSGLGVELCRVLTAAVLGPGGKTAFRLLSSARDYDAVGQDDVVFLTADDVRGHGLAPVLVPGPVVFVAELTVLAQPGVTGIAGSTVCFLSGSQAHQALEAWASRTAVTFVRSAFQEDGEMHDAFAARRCDAMAGERTELESLHLNGHALPPLGVAPVFSATNTSDGAWAGLVGWALSAVLQSERAPNPWRADPPGTDLPGLRPGWQAEVGSYDDLRRQAGILPGVNALWPEGLLLPSGPR